MEAINKERFENEAKNGLVVLDFSAPWCPDCVKIEPIMKLLSEEYAGKVKFFKINIDSEEELKEAYNIRRIPTLVFLKDGAEVGERLVEPDNKVSIENGVKNLLA